MVRGEYTIVTEVAELHTHWSRVTPSRRETRSKGLDHKNQEERRVHKDVAKKRKTSMQR